MPDEPQPSQPPGASVGRAINDVAMGIALAAGQDDPNPTASGILLGIQLGSEDPDLCRAIMDSMQAAGVGTPNVSNLIAHLRSAVAMKDGQTVDTPRVEEHSRLVN